MDTQILGINIVKKLVKSGYKAYFAGGWVRDYLMGHPSEDIDIATDAPPEKIIDLFPRTILVGLAFGVVVVVVDGHQFEVATFRRDIDYVNGRKPTKIELSTPEEDAARRDFTINGMFYDPLLDEVYDYVQGKEDLKHRVIRTIGDPYERFAEDRLRMIRAIRFAARFDFVIDVETQEAIRANADTLFPAVAMERIWNEFCKMSRFPRFDSALIDMHRMELLPCIFPLLNGVHLDEMRKRVAPFTHYPKATPAIVYLMTLFPEATIEVARDLASYLRTSKAEAYSAEFFVKMQHCVRKEEEQGLVDKVEWTYLYAHHLFLCLIEVIAAHMNAPHKEEFLEKHRKRMSALDKHINRLIQKKPLVNADLLQTQGVLPGKMMGMLLKEAERIAIARDLLDSDEVLIYLKFSELWPKG